MALNGGIGPEYIACFDEGVWVYRALDMEGIITDLHANQALGALMLYQKNPALRQQRDPTIRLGDGGRGVVLDYYRAAVDSLDYAEGYRISPGNGGLFKHSRSPTARPDAGGKILAHRIAPDVFHDLLSNHRLEGRLD